MKHIRQHIRKIVTLGTLTALMGLISPLRADYCADTGGYCYEDCRRAPCIAPAIALGTVALVAIIAVAVQNSGHSESCHSHSN